MPNATVYCHYRYTPVPTCDQTYARFLGSVYDGSQIFYSCVVAIMLVVCWSLLIRVLRNKKSLFPLDSQKKMFLLVCFTTLTFIPRSIDMFGWRDWIPTTVIQLCYDWGSSAILTVVLLVIADWLRVLLKTMARTEYSHFVHNSFNGFIAWTWIFYTVGALGQANAQDYSIFRGAKLICFATCLLGVTTMQTVFGFQIWWVLRQNEKTWFKKHRRTGTSSSPTSPRTNNAGGSRQIPAAVAGSLSVPSNSQQENSTNASSEEATEQATQRRKSSKINRILKLLFLAGVLELIAVAVGYNAAKTAINSGDTLDHSSQQPTAFIDIITEGEFDIIQAIAIFLVCWFFRPSRPKRADDDDSSTNASRSKKSSAPKKPQPRQGRAGTDRTLALAAANRQRVGTESGNEPLPENPVGDNIQPTKSGEVTLSVSDEQLQPLAKPTV